MVVYSLVAILGATMDLGLLWSLSLIHISQEGTAIKTESNNATPTAVLAETPHTTKSGITSTGPPAPDLSLIHIYWET